MIRKTEILAIKFEKKNITEQALERKILPNIRDDTTKANLLFLVGITDV